MRCSNQVLMTKACGELIIFVMTEVRTNSETGKSLTVNKSEASSGCAHCDSFDKSRSGIFNFISRPGDFL